MNKIFRNIASGALTLAACVVMAACSETENNFERSQPIASDNMGVYFPSSNESMVLRADDDEAVVDIVVARTVTTEAAEVPIYVVSKTDNMNCPTVAKFAAGEAQTIIQATYTSLEVTPKCEIMVDEKYGNPYLIKDGSTHYSFSVYKMRQVTTSIYVEPNSAADIDYFGGVTDQVIYQLGSDNRFIWRDFLGSGIDLQFKIDGYFDSEDVHNSYGGVTPLDHYQGDEFGWMFMRDASPSSDSEDYMTWTPEGGAGSIESYIYFFYPYEGYYYFYIDLRNYGDEVSPWGYGSISAAVIDDESNYNSYYVYIYF